MVTLLLVDLRQMKSHSKSRKTKENVVNRSKNGSQPQHTSLPPNDPPDTPIFDHFLGEEILDKVLSWSLSTREYMSELKLEQLKVGV